MNFDADNTQTEELHVESVVDLSGQRYKIMRIEANNRTIGFRAESVDDSKKESSQQREGRA